MAAPIQYCPKCGSRDGFDGPRFRVRTRMVPGGYLPVVPRDFEVLAFACLTCGYEYDMPCLDAPAPLPPPIDRDPGVEVGGRGFGWPWRWRRG